MSIEEKAHPKLLKIFTWVISKRWWFVALYTLLLIPSVYFAIGIKSDNGVDRLVVASDPEYIAAKAFEKVFGSGEYGVVIVEADNLYSPEALAKTMAIEKALDDIDKVSVQSALSIYSRSKGGFVPTAESAAAFKTFAEGSSLLTRQAPVGKDFIGIAAILDVHSTEERNVVLEKVETALQGFEKDLKPLRYVARVGLPFVYSYLDQETRSSSALYGALFGLFIIGLVVALYRSWRTLVAFILALGASVLLACGYIGATNGMFTIVSALVPMTILITCTATLVYLHSRFVDCPPDSNDAEHLVFALSNKFLACTASIFATAVGFGALAVSKIRPIREMGIWVAVGLVFTWFVVFTLFPALQTILKTPTEKNRKMAGDWMTPIADRLPRLSYRFRWILVPVTLIMTGLGAVALFGLPGLIEPMQMETNAIDYISRSSPLYKDTTRFEKQIGGISITELWLQGKLGDLSSPKVLRGLHRFEESLVTMPMVGASIGPTSLIRTLRYVSGRGDQLPDTDEELEALSDTLETQLQREPMLSRFIEPTNMSQTHVSVLTKSLDYPAFEALKKNIDEKWAAAVAAEPALSSMKLQVAGLGPLQAKIAYHLVPTLVESFGLTVAIIFITFLLVFRSGPARVMAMIPSLFAIFAMFGFMRLFGMSLNVATILVASTVLGTSENDQVHFFYHYQEKHLLGATVEQSLRHTLLIAGRAIVFATLINAGGFLAFALADLPPVRQFGILSSLAFVLSMIADFTALPAALWMVFRSKPDPAAAAK
jgi:predicted RND superfamily exporter protein